MLKKWKAFWSAGKAAWKGNPLQPSAARWSAAQWDALVQLQTNYWHRKKELDAQFPDISFSIQLISEEQQEWEWFPEPSNQLWVNGLHQEISRYPANFHIIAYDPNVKIKDALVQLVSFGIRNKHTKEAIVKAKVSISVQKSNEDVQHLFKELGSL